jgi:hypothetical protein
MPKKKSSKQLDREVLQALPKRVQAAQKKLAAASGPSTYRTTEQLERDIKSGLPKSKQPGYKTGQLGARGLVASELKMFRPSDDELLQYVEEVIKDPNVTPRWLVGTYGAFNLAPVIGADVWTHGNLWREKHKLTPAAEKWFADYADGFVTELRKIRDEIEQRLPS